MKVPSVCVSWCEKLPFLSLYQSQRCDVTRYILCVRPFA